MGVYIKGLQMPSECADCDFCTCGTHCSALKFHDVEDAILHGTRYGGCPLIPVPDHGDLVDIDKMLDDFAELRDYDFASREYVVIPAERSEE